MGDSPGFQIHTGTSLLPRLERVSSVQFCHSKLEGAMHVMLRRNYRAVSALGLVLSLAFITQAQKSVSSGQPATPVTILDSTKEQDGLAGSVRRVKTEYAKLEMRSGVLKEGPLQLLELTTYALNGNRVENVSYPVVSPLVGKEEYRYDAKGNIVEMTMKGKDGSIVSREAYEYELDRFGNWKKMVTSLVVFEDGQLKREPIEVTYRTITYYFDNAVATVLDSRRQTMPTIPSAATLRELETSDLPTGPVPATRIRFSRIPSSFFTDIPPEHPVSRPRVHKTVQPTITASEQKNSSSKDAAPSFATEVKNVTPREDTMESSTVGAPSGDSMRVASDLYKSGRASFDTGDPKEAIKFYLQSIEVQPDSADVHLSLAYAYFKLSKSQDAIKSFKQAIKLDPKSAESHYGLGLLYYTLKRIPDAASEFKKATSVIPDMAKAHYGLALAYQEMGNQDGLVSEYRIVQKLDSGLARKLAASFPDFNLPCRTSLCK
jgi:Flp pilus assembly protein TadD